MNRKMITSFHSKLVAVLLLLFGGTSLTAQVTIGFENLQAQTFSSPNCLYNDPNFTTAHTLADFAAVCGTIVVSAAKDIANNQPGFSIVWSPTGANAGSGFSDSDAFGVATSASMATELGVAAHEGVQALLSEDVDGEVFITFDPVFLPSSGAPMFTGRYALGATSWESIGDYLHMWIEIKACPAATTVTLVNTTGIDIDGNFTEGAWVTVNADLTAYVGCNAILHIDHSTNAAAEEMGWDNLAFSLGSLPVELTSFTARATTEKMVDLQWETASELNNEGFEIQHSINGRDWMKVDFIEGSGTFNELIQYQYMHKNPANGINYYRLKQMDFDGEFDYSQVEVVEIQVGVDVAAKEQLQVFPNPTTGNLTVGLPQTLQDANNLTFEIFNPMGQLLRSTTQGTQAFIQLNLNDLQQGHYILRVQEGSEVFSTRFMKL